MQSVAICAVSQPRHASLWGLCLVIPCWLAEARTAELRTRVMPRSRLHVLAHPLCVSIQPVRFRIGLSTNASLRDFLPLATMRGMPEFGSISELPATPLRLTRGSEGAVPGLSLVYTLSGLHRLRTYEVLIALYCRSNCIDTPAGTGYSVYTYIHNVHAF